MKFLVLGKSWIIKKGLPLGKQEVSSIAPKFSDYMESMKDLFGG